MAPKMCLWYCIGADIAEETAVDNCTNIAEFHIVSDELQVEQGYKLRDRAILAPPDRLGFPCAGAIIAEPSTHISQVKKHLW